MCIKVNNAIENDYSKILFNLRNDEDIEPFIHMCEPLVGWEIKRFNNLNLNVLLHYKIQTNLSGQQTLARWWWSKQYHLGCQPFVSSRAKLVRRFASWWLDQREHETQSTPSWWLSLSQSNSHWIWFMRQWNMGLTQRYVAPMLLEYMCGL